MDYKVTGAELSGIANAIRTKGETTAPLTFPSGFTRAINAIPTGITPSGTYSVTQNGIYDIVSYASVDVNVSGGGTDDRFVKLVNGTISVAEDVNVTYIRLSAFAYCFALTTASFPNVTSIGSSAFNYCTALTSVNFPNATSMGLGAFINCSALTSVSLPNVTGIEQSAFMNCPALTSVSLPNATYIGYNAFARCRALTTANFPNVRTITSTAFQSCYNLLSLYLLSSSVASLISVPAFVSTPIGGYTASTGGVYGSIFVPSSLYDSYISATNWSAFSSRFVSV